MLSINCVMEELVKHLQVMGVVAVGLQCWIFIMLSQELLPVFIFEVRCNIVQNLFFLKT